MIFIRICNQTCRFGYKNEMKIYSRTLRYLMGSLEFSISKVRKLAIKKTATTQKVVVMNGLVLLVKKYISKKKFIAICKENNLQRTKSDRVIEKLFVY